MSAVLMGMAFAAAALAGCSAQDNASAAQASAALVEAEISVDGMVCGGCENAISERVAGVDGVVEVKADREKAVAHVKYDQNKVKLDALVATINELGYKAQPAAAPVGP